MKRLFSLFTRWLHPFPHFALALWARYKDTRRRSICQADPQTRFALHARIANHQRHPQQLQLGRDTTICGSIEVFPHGGKVTIGDDSFLGEDSRISCACEVRIGHRVLIAHSVNIVDWNAHSLSASERHMHYRATLQGGHPTTLTNVPAAPIIIEDDAWLSFGVTVLKGVHIGRGAVIGAGTMVTQDVPAFAVVAGHDQRIIGHARA